eukprot:9457792-Pyramimonas_sp.AAC.2
MILACADDLWFALRNVLLELSLLLPLLQSLGGAVGLSLNLKTCIGALRAASLAAHVSGRTASPGALGARCFVDLICAAHSLSGVQVGPGGYLHARRAAVQKYHQRCVEICRLRLGLAMTIR